MIDNKINDVLEGLKVLSKSDFSNFCRSMLPSPLPTISEYLFDYIQKHNLSASEVIKKSGLSKDYAYAIFNGNRSNPTRDRVIALCLAMNMTLEDACTTLALCKALLYPLDRRDAAIVLCFYRKIYDINQVNIFLNENGLPVLETTRSLN